MSIKDRSLTYLPKKSSSILFRVFETLELLAVTGFGVEGVGMHSVELHSSLSPLTWRLWIWSVDNSARRTPVSPNIVLAAM